MEDIKEIIKLLIALQEKDTELDQARGQTSDIPQKIAEKNAEITALRNEVEAKKKNLSQLQLKKKEKELELSTKEGEIKKHSTELNAVKTNDAYRALMIEIESLKQDKSNLETEILEIMVSIDTEASHSKEDEKTFKTKEAAIKAEIENLESELKKFQEAAQQKESERNEFAKTIPSEILRKYTFVRESREGLAIVPIDGETCSGCRIQIRPQIINELYREKEIITCESCSRILYKK
jgi:predicted  nucleic acid-binding Zn-ribbon protein